MVQAIDRAHQMRNIARAAEVSGAGHEAPEFLHHRHHLRIFHLVGLIALEEDVELIGAREAIRNRRRRDVVFLFGK